MRTRLVLEQLTRLLQKQYHHDHWVIPKSLVNKPKCRQESHAKKSAHSQQPQQNHTRTTRFFPTNGTTSATTCGAVFSGRKERHAAMHHCVKEKSAKTLRRGADASKRARSILDLSRLCVIFAQELHNLCNRRQLQLPSERLVATALRLSPAQGRCASGSEGAKGSRGPRLHKSGGELVCPGPRPGDELFRRTRSHHSRATQPANNCVPDRVSPLHTQNA